MNLLDRLLPILIIVAFTLIGVILISVCFILLHHEQVFSEQPEPQKGDTLLFYTLIGSNTLIGQGSVYYPELKIYATITAYNPTEAQCDNTPDIMASGARVYEGAIACPRELAFGTQVEIDGIIYTCEDRTAKRYNGRYDILMFDYQEAIEWGRQEKEVLIY